MREIVNYNKKRDVFSMKKLRSIWLGNKSRNNLAILFAYVILFTAVLFVVLPLFWIFLTSIKAPDLAYRIPPEWFFTPTLENYRSLAVDASFPKFFINSAIVASSTTILALIFGSLSAYSISRFRTGGDFFLGYLFNSRTMPVVAILIPIFLLSNRIGLVDTYPTLIIPYLSFLLPFAIWMLIGFFNNVSVEMEDAALVDGATRMQALRYVTIPIAAPGIAATGILCFLFSWNEFLLALILTGNNTRTLPVAVANYLTTFGIKIGDLSAATTVMIIPVMLLAFSIRGYLVKGLSLGAVK